jgi:hypothetical protein
MVDALALLGEEAGIDAFLLERLDKLPHHPTYTVAMAMRLERSTGSPYSR